MKGLINQKYNDFIMNSFEFREFVAKMDKYSTEEIQALYGLKSDIISCFADPLKMPTSKQVDV